MYVYVNQEKLFTKEFDSLHYFGFDEIDSEDIDQDGYYELVYKLDTGGTDNYHTAETGILKYQNHKRIPMVIP